MIKLNKFREFDYSKSDEKEIEECINQGVYFSSPTVNIGKIVASYSTLKNSADIKSKKHINLKNNIIYAIGIVIALFSSYKMLGDLSFEENTGFSIIAHIGATGFLFLLIYGFIHFLTDIKVYNYYVGTDGIELFTMESFNNAPIIKQQILYSSSSLKLSELTESTIISTETLNREYSFTDNKTNNVISIKVEPKNDNCMYLLAKKSMYYYILNQGINK